MAVSRMPPAHALAIPSLPGTAGRHEAIVHAVDDAGEVSVVWLAARLGVSEVTIRKDLERLGAERRLVRTRGGAISIRTDRQERDFDERVVAQRWRKLAIGRTAASLVVDGQVIALDASTTAFAMAQAIRRRGGWQHLVVATNGLRVAQELAFVRGIDVVLPGGLVRAQAWSVSDVDDLGFADAWPDPIDAAYFGAVGLSVDLGLTEQTEAEARIKRAAVARSTEVVGLVDHSKWGRIGPAPFCPTSRLARVITDAGAAPALLGSLAACHVPVSLAHTRADA